MSEPEFFLSSRQSSYDVNTENTFIMNNIDASNIPLALYIHIPWCVKKCPYCDFNSHEQPEDMPYSMYETYVDTLLLDARMQQVLTQGRKIGSIFIGGGTPSLLPIEQYRRLFAALRKIFDFAIDIEVTMEANPGTLEHAPFAEYLKVGINRLSIGVQSFDADKLQTLGRIHNPKQALSSINAARAAGFERVNVDLMHGLPKQTLTEAIHDIQLAHDAGATHISWYQLTIEPNTVFYRSQPILPDEDSLADIEQAGQALLHHLGYKNYEVSAWVGKTDIPCRHNINYWEFGDYLAIGAGAHGKITIGKKGLLDDNKLSVIPGIYRFSKSRLPKDYVIQTDEVLSTPKMVGWQAIAYDELVSEFMLNVLRLHDGVPWSLFEARTGLKYECIASEIKALINKGLLVDNVEHLQTSELGRRYLNQILREFL